MPKMKTKSAVKKRFRVTGTGKLKSGQAKTSHMMMNKSKKMKRKANRTMILADVDAKILLDAFLPYARKKKNKPNKEPYIAKALRAEGAK